ncbi:MazG nucleotide pyrophosphohydrolase domain-containing protein [Thermosediminibacter litoriperuensis]|uniref:NTP pyrophosphatase (Non-canonical NTP hydrolase) n=1 Tax=Thermosediminibacter litoriperuensis TaxID=291989 RepID=A0A5S5AWX1_9FIRM|nr:MazG nucleotide pyrophosphohydrolase domain-containing protein [Thermosediminibacter litoriperuensis]TYP57462.1 NTP pyrophosphatase (non-canonical NTP hydrolase) [Thermosediminibacter litoriperuensis]
MDLMDLQEKVDAFIKGTLGAEVPAGVRLMDLVAEVGELSKEFLKATDYGERAFETTGGWESEMGDVLFSLISLANVTGVKLEECLLKALDKYQERFYERGGIGSGE